MTTGIKQHDGSKCYAGPSCRLHGNHALKNDLSSKMGQVDYEINQMKLAKKRRNALLVIRNHGDNIIVRNRSAGAYKQPYVNLKDMLHSDIARGNCWAITDKILSTVKKVDFEAEILREISITTGTRGINHTALLVKDADITYVVDYTARQFNQNLPFPMIETIDDWKQKIEQAYGKKFDFDNSF